MSTDDQAPILVDASKLEPHVQVPRRSRRLVAAPSPFGSSPLSSASSGTFRSYRRRWLLVGVAAALNLANAFNWLTFAPVATLAADYFDVTQEKVNWFSMVFAVAAFPCSFTLILLDVWGLRPCLILACWLNGLGATVRFLATTEFVRTVESFNGPYVVAMIGQTLASTAQPMTVGCGTKIAAIWFPDGQRAVANALVSLSNALGLMVANVVVPNSVKSPSSVSSLLLYSFLPSALLALVASFSVLSSRPPSPPSASASEPPPPIMEGLKRLFGSRCFWLLMLLGGTSIGISSAVVTLIQQIICVKGYSATFGGDFGAVSIGVGVILSLCVGVFVDKKGRMEEAVKILFSLATLGLLGFYVATSLTSSSSPPSFSRHAAIAASLIVFGSGCLSSYPLSLELAVECCFPAPEATAAGVVFLFGQIVAGLSIGAAPALGRTPSADDAAVATCGDTTPIDFTWATLMMCGVLVVAGGIFVLFFVADYRRADAAERAAAERILAFGRTTATAAALAAASRSGEADQSNGRSGTRELRRESVGRSGQVVMRSEESLARSGDGRRRSERRRSQKRRARDEDGRGQETTTPVA